MRQYDFIAIGDTVTDAFIRLKDASVHCNIDKEKCEICLRFKDKIPYEEVYVVSAVGNAANASVVAARLGLQSALISNIGDDYFGEEALGALKKENVGAEFVTVNNGKKTNYHYVLWYEDDRTILIKHQEYDYRLPYFNDPKWVYFSSMGENSMPFHEVFEKYMSEHPNVKLAFQPGTYQMKFGRKKLAGIYRRTDVFISNKEETQRILEVGEPDVKKLMKGIMELGPKIAVVTDGTEGAYAYDGKSAWFMPPYPDPKPPYERTGAGDAFSSTFVVALCLGLSVQDALRWAPINSMSVVQYVGAREGLLTRYKLEKYLSEAPADYIPKLI
ncbi:MAG: Sugar kinase, ribokinase family [Candidatus Giovannonibacteria bacterium GW2011_GWC2_44_9]|uniref:Sugar kinase, ribokinase family n=3 Tax=Candidatus Giovannoniibacteriota TaxID=1752738 RepID=A0A0G1L4Z8_9BACT|nr:MAG: Sugar kinase, ribokinase family [Candidatus Giovannonibacteria bacterium GW2011_GWB1_44_23]KKT63672.1 MAG: Sugar kinase, ribokinase family [Candidatus Giovannonibacteria bacterium GW2011_GWA1_44_29]KKT84343.1 MAG: Sugar kinase, ribokinase family [Candidatus Giovannonibacteria bacterium GW2011_GWC2_44_9]KKT91394.1 MAG: Sugar kinase, ribokinase family [Parcubacteria group bacterium GW2011_GWC1_45_13]